MYIVPAKDAGIAAIAVVRPPKLLAKPVPELFATVHFITLLASSSRLYSGILSYSLLSTYHLAKSIISSIASRMASDIFK